LLPSSTDDEDKAPARRKKSSSPSPAKRRRYTKQSCGSGFIESGSESGSSISVESGSRVLMTKDRRKKIQLKILSFKTFFDQKLQFTYVQATEEAFSPQNRTSSS
jgi:hypothetical protein